MTKDQRLMTKDQKLIEQDLVGRILRGERQAFEWFFRTHRGDLRRFIQSRVSNEADVEELVQDSFLGFLDSLPLFSFRSRLKTFLYSIASHEVADYFRRRYAKRALRLVPIVGEYVAQELYSSRELSERIDRVYRQLMVEYAVILRLKYEEGWSVARIARKMRLSVKAAESKLFRARKAFQMAYLELVE